MEWFRDLLVITQEHRLPGYSNPLEQLKDRAVQKTLIQIKAPIFQLH